MCYQQPCLFPSECTYVSYTNTQTTPIFFQALFQFPALLQLVFRSRGPTVLLHTQCEVHSLVHAVEQKVVLALFEEFSADQGTPHRRIALGQ